MELAAVLDQLGLQAYAEALSPRWDEAQRAAAEPLQRILQPDRLATACLTLELSATARARALFDARRIAGDPALLALARYVHYALFACPGYPRASARKWPEPFALHPAGERGAQPAGQAPGTADPVRLFYLIVLASGLEAALAFFRQRGIPAEIQRDTLSDFQRWLDDAHAKRGAEALTTAIIPWLMHHLTGEIFQLGRLQFAPGPFWGDLTVYRRRRDGAVIALSKAGVVYRNDGRCDGSGGATDPVGRWTAEFTEEPGEAADAAGASGAERASGAEKAQLSGAVVGHPIHPAGYAVRTPVRLRLSEWTPVLAPGDPCLHIHMPAGSPMDFAACGRSFAQALEFFPRHFPEVPIVAFVCGSWLLEPSYEQLLAPKSNIVRFQQETYLFPTRSGPNSALERVFGRVPDDLSDLSALPRDTSLRRAIIDHLQAGGNLGGGGCFLFPEDLNWGSQVYRRQGLPAVE